MTTHAATFTGALIGGAIATVVMWRVLPWATGRMLG